jgi:hypothetical protein
MRFRKKRVLMREESCECITAVRLGGFNDQIGKKDRAVAMIFFVFIR